MFDKSLLLELQNLQTTVIHSNSPVTNLAFQTILTDLRKISQFAHAFKRPGIKNATKVIERTVMPDAKQILGGLGKTFPN